MGVQFTPDLAALRQQIRLQIEAIKQGTGNPTIRAGVKKAGEAYLAFSRKQFEQRTSGSGWAPLAISTQKQRKRQGFSEAAPILFRSGELFKALYSGNPGNLFKFYHSGVLVGFDANGAVHSKYSDRTGGKLTIGAIAAIQNKGTDIIPKRQIIYPPDSSTKNVMRGAIQAAIQMILSK